MSSPAPPLPPLTPLLTAPRGWTAFLHSPRFLPALILLWAFAYLPNLGLRDLRLEEGRRATPAAEMLATGNYALPTLAGIPYFNKPPLFFWLIAATGQLFGQVDAFVARLPSALSLLARAGVLLAFARQDFLRPTRSLAALMLLASPVMIDKGAIAEIDTFLTLLVGASWAVFWSGYQQKEKTFQSWILIGLFQAIAVLAKAPGGPAEFYIPVLLFLLWQRQLKYLFSLGHLLCILIFLAPTLAWIALLVSRHQFPLSSGLANWGNQLGFNTLPGNDSEPDTTVSLQRYLRFPLEVFLMTAPWTLWTLSTLIPAVRRCLSIPPALWQFLTCAFLGLTLAFWLWPSAHPRHMLAVVFPACLLAAIVGASFWQSAQSRLHQITCRFLAVIPLLAAATILFIAWHLLSLDLSQKILAGTIAAASLLVALALWRLSRHQQTSDTALGVLAGLAIVILTFRAAATVTFYPYQAPRDATRIARTQLQQLVASAPSGSLWTTRTFPGKGDDYYNVLFYLAPSLQGISPWNQPPVDVSPIILMTPEEITQAQLADRHVTELGRVPVKAGKPPLVVIRMSAAIPATTQP